MIAGGRAKPLPSAPGLAASFPHLSSVPAKPANLSASDQQQIRAQLEAANQAALARLAPGQAAPVQASKPATPAPAPRAAPLLIGFPSGSAIIPRAQQGLLQSMAQQRGAAPAILAAGFAPADNAAGLRLALRRALAIANQLTDAGMPLADIRLAALASGHGGFAELLYAQTMPRPVPIPAAKDHS